MSIDHLFGALGGLGLFLFSLRTLTRVLQRSLSRRLRGIFGKGLAHPLQCILAGLLGTSVVQASSITVMASMSLVGSTLITLEQGFFVMLGATLGTSIKSWFVHIDALFFGPLLVGLSSLSLLFLRRSSFRDISEGVLAISLALWGMWLIGLGLGPVLDLPFFQDLIRHNPGVTLAEQATGVLLGFVLAACVQSSSTVVAFTIVLASQFHLTYPQAASLILGANVGTTLGPLIASIEYGPNLRRLAVAHFACKAGGVLITLFFFPQFIQFWGQLVAFESDPSRLMSLRLAAVHTGFNLINVIWWTLFSGILLKWIRWLLPSKIEAPSSALAPLVRRILRRSPERSREEALRQLQQLLVCVKSLLDRGTALMLGDQTRETRLENRILEQREFQSLKESTYELLVQASQHLRTEMRVELTRLADLEELYYQSWRLSELLEEGLLRENFSLPPSFSGLVTAYQKAIDGVWLTLLFPYGAKAPEEDPAEVANRFDALFIEQLRQEEQVSSLQLAWTFDLMSNLRSVLLHLQPLLRGGLSLSPVTDQHERGPVEGVGVIGGD